MQAQRPVEWSLAEAKTAKVADRFWPDAERRGYDEALCCVDEVIRPIRAVRIAANFTDLGLYELQPRYDSQEPKPAAPTHIYACRPGLCGAI